LAQAARRWRSSASIFPFTKKAVSKVLAEARDCLISGITLPE